MEINFLNFKNFKGMDAQKIFNLVKNYITVMNLSNIGFIWLTKETDANLTEIGKVLFPKGITKVQRTQANLCTNVYKAFKKVGIELKNEGRKWGVREFDGGITHKENFYLEFTVVKNRYKYICNETGKRLSFGEIKDSLKVSKPDHNYRTFRLDNTVKKLSFMGHRF